VLIASIVLPFRCKRMYRAARDADAVAIRRWMRGDSVSPRMSRVFCQIIIFGGVKGDSDSDDGLQG
jgi:hypothetical protein